jgi:cell division cycle protein 20 (cofactor of APC complex)
VSERTLDAPDVLGEFPSQLLDINSRDMMAVALGASVYIWRDGTALELMSGDTPIDSVCWVADFLAFSGAGHTELWDVTRQCAVQLYTDHCGRSSAMAAFQTRLATGGADGMIHVYDQRSDLSKQFRAHHDDVSALAWSPDGAYLASGGADASVILWGPGRRQRIDHSAPVSGLAWLPSGVLLTGENGQQGAVRLVHKRNEDEDHCVLTGAPVSGICCTQWGIAVGHEDANGVWELWAADLSRHLADYRGHSQGIVGIACNPQGDMVATISTDRTLRVWDLTAQLATPSNSPMGRYSPSTSPGKKTTPSRSQPTAPGRTTPISFLR